MTVARKGIHHGICRSVSSEADGEDDERLLTFADSIGEVHSSLRVGANVHHVHSLMANLAIAHVGVALHARGLALDASEARQLHSVATIAGVKNVDTLIRATTNGRDVAQLSRNAFVLDLYDLNEDALKQTGPIYQHVLNTVRPERAQNGRASYRKLWWVFGEPRPDMRRAIAGLRRYIVTPLTAVHRYFLFLGPEIIPDQALVVIASDDSFDLGVLSSRIHVIWAITAGGRLGVGNDPRYNKTLCFDPFPFPRKTENDEARISTFGEQLDAHRKKQQALHPGLTMTGMYNVLEKLRSGETLTDKEKTIHEQGLVSVLKQIHDELDAAVFDAYGWPVTLTDEEILERLVALNAERAAEEARGLIRWLRPDFQNRSQQTQQAIDVEETSDEETATTKKPTKAKESAKKLPLPEKLPEQVLAIRQQLSTASKPLTAADMAKLFTRAKADRIEELLQSLVILGSARQVDGNKFVAA